MKLLLLDTIESVSLHYLFKKVLHIWFNLLLQEVNNKGVNFAEIVHVAITSK